MRQNIELLGAFFSGCCVLTLCNKNLKVIAIAAPNRYKQVHKQERKVKILPRLTDNLISNFYFNRHLQNLKQMRKRYHFLWAILFSCLLCGRANAQTSVSGKVLDAQTGETLVGANLVVKGKVVGTISDIDGNFKLRTAVPLPFTLVVSVVGYSPQEVEVTENEQSLEIKLETKAIFGEEVVISASRVEESILESPVSIEKMDVLAVQQTAAADYYQSIANLKGVDVSSSSINFQTLNARGFNSTGNTRFVQLIDGMDSQAPALNFPAGNLLGPSELDVESLEFIPGSASALYGPNAFNGILLINSKNPFEYQGISAFAKLGINHIGKDSDPEIAQFQPGIKPMYEFSARYAKAFKDRFAFKLNFSYKQAQDWRGLDFSDVAVSQKGDLSENPGKDIVHAFGDVAALPLPLVALQLPETPLSPYYGDIPNQIVSRTPYYEAYVVDYNAKNLKANAALHYRITDNLEASYLVNYGNGTTVYTGAQRYSFKNFSTTQHRIQLKADNFFVRGYTTIEDAGDSYIADAVATSILNKYKPHGQWFAEYALGYLGAMAGSGVKPGQSSTLTPAQISAFHSAGRTAADKGRYDPNSAQFKQAKAEFAKKFIPKGGRFDDHTLFYHLEGQYNFKNQIKFMDLQVGASYRLFDLNSNGTVFPDNADNDITIQEYGFYLQASKRLLNDNLKLQGSLRYDKNENFKGQITPRFSAVLTLAENHNIRGSVQTGFRLPSTQGQHIDLDVGYGRILGGLPQYAASYKAYENAYTKASVDKFVEAVSKSGSATAVVNPKNLALLEAVPKGGYAPVKPEQVRSFELGYKSLIGNKLLLDFVYYYNQYTDFITQVQVRKAAGDVSINPINAQSLLVGGSKNTFQIYTNVSENISAHGTALGMNYSLPKNYTLSFNYNWNKQIKKLSEEFINGFNTPEHKVNLSFANRKLTKKLGFNLTYRWQNAFRWEASFGRGTVERFSTVDAQLSLKLSKMKSILKVGGANILNKQYNMNFGGPRIGAIYYVSLTFDQFMN